MASILALYISPTAGAPMLSRKRVRAVANVGIEGDRYAKGIGAWSKAKRETIRDITLISREAIVEANDILIEWGMSPFEWNETRRNIVVEGVSLNDLVGKRFQIGCVIFEGIELADPCKRPQALTGKPGFEKAFHNRGGLRARIVRGGRLEVGQLVKLFE